MANSAFDHSAAITLPSSSTNTALVRWSGTGGNTLTDSTILVGATTMGLAADTDLLTFSNGTLTIGGTLAATTLTGAGSGITSIKKAEKYSEKNTIAVELEGEEIQEVLQNENLESKSQYNLYHLNQHIKL